ncbi:hypothetical protein BIV60_13880 [Bacillus sp. MUM 116]|uniref:hypothetical protein n=1 Tax=Bacillus sp. MUM 116 TaxID=1678002 RepID=UPI0008F58D50|nr:hypothetical protein [Bacillus sp. MUM 116]OIK13579.1 hypothetical protein BIV60_13880 [Bacillus sp. MUM 116]
MSKLLELVDEKKFGKGAIGFDNGFMINSHDDMVDYLIVEFEDRFEVYLNIYDNGKTPNRDFLAEGLAEDLEEAKEIAVRNLEKIAYQSH